MSFVYLKNASVTVTIFILFGFQQTFHAKEVTLGSI